MAANLENVLRKSRTERLRADDIRPEMEAIERELIALAAALPRRSAVPAEKSTASAETEKQRETLKTVLSKLDAQLEHGDTAAIPLYEEHADMLCTALGPLSDKFAREINQFDFEAARKTLRTLLD
jgi:stress response protein YsnF